jgi:hypothetical protein
LEEFAAEMLKMKGLPELKGDLLDVLSDGSCREPREPCKAARLRPILDINPIREES